MGYVNELLLIGVLALSLISCKSADGVAGSDLNFKIDDDSQSGAKIYLSEASSRQLEERISECPANPNDHKQCFVICHVPPGNPNNSHSLIVPLPAVNAHMKHGHNGHDTEKRDNDKGKDKDKDKGKGKDKGSYRGDYMGRCDGSGTGGTTGGTTGTTDGGTSGGTDGGSTGGTDGGTTGGTTGGTDGGTTGGTDGSTTGGTDGGTTDGTTTGGTTDGGSTGGTDGGTTSGGTTGGDDEPVFCEWTHPNDLDCDGRHDDTGELIF